MTVVQTQAIGTPMHKPELAHDAARSAWARNWEFWLAVGLAAFLRLWHIELTQFLKDQVDLMMLTRPAIIHGVLPITSTYSSIGTYHPPMAVYFLLPIYAFTTNPLPGVISIALVNILAVALTYIFALRYFGRLAASAAALLFATSNVLINYSRFLWQPNYIAFVTLLMVMALYRGCVRGKPNALVLGALLLLVDVLVHPANLLLAPILLLALLAAPTRPGRRAWLIGGGVALVMLLPSILFEGFVSHGANLPPPLFPFVGQREARPAGGAFADRAPEWLG
jgi:Dolichyl-phosphate-mannose-protein mannosyltransferase